MVKQNCIYCDLMSSLASHASTDLRGTVDVLTNHAIRHLNVNAADVLVYDAAAQQLVNVGGRGFRGHGMENAIRHLEDTPAGKAVIEKNILQVTVPRAADAFAQLTGLTNEDFVAYVAAPLVVNDQVEGVLELWNREKLDPNATWLYALEQIAEKGAITLGNVMRVRRLQRTNVDLAQAYDATIDAWSQALELRDYEPKGHTLRVTEMVVDFARLIGLSEPELVNIRRGARLHDMGKMGIPDQILLKPGALTAEEWTIMYRHPLIAYEYLSPVEFLTPALDIPRYHHEKWDGTGYPYGLQGADIPLAARIFALVDVWDSLRSDRPFRKGWPEDKVKQHIYDRAGKHFDSDLADKFLKLLEAAKRKQTEAERALGRTYETKSFNS